MAISNTSILIRRSANTAVPTSLKQGEFAYSYKSNTLFFGTPGSDGVINIGGQYYTSTLDSATDSATNNTLVRRDASGSASFTTIYGELGTNSGVAAGTYGDQTHIPVVTVAANGLVTNVSTSQISTSLSISADSGSNTLSLITDTLTVTGGDGITSSIAPDTQTVTLDVDDTVFRSNTALFTQYIDSNIEISGNIHVLGTYFLEDVKSLLIEDPLIYLAANNYYDDIVDIGFVGNYYDAGTDTQRHAGVMRHAGDKDFYMFYNYDKEPTSNTVDIGDASFLVANTHANIISPGLSQFANTSFSQRADFNGKVYLESGLSAEGGALDLYPSAPINFHTVDNTTYSYIYNDGSTANDYLTFGTSSVGDAFYLFGDPVSGSNQLIFNHGLDIRDGSSHESLLSKGEQKYGIVTRFHVDGANAVTQQTITDPNVPPAVGNMSMQDLGTDYDDSFTTISLPFNVNFNGTTYDTIYVGSNGYITFDAGSNNNDSAYPPVATNPGGPAIVMAMGDISYQRVYTLYQGDTFRIRYEGNHTYSGQRINGSSDIIWEVVFYNSVPGQFDLRYVKVSGSANDGTGGLYNVYLTNGTYFLDDRVDRTKPYALYNNYIHQLTNGDNSLSINEDGNIFATGVRNDAAPGDVVFFNPTTKELTYGALGALNPTHLANGSYTLYLSGDDGTVTATGKYLTPETDGISTVGGGYTFSNDGGYDTGMFSHYDGELNFFSNDNLIFNANNQVFKHSTNVELQHGAVLQDNSNKSIFLGFGIDSGDTYSQRISIGYQPTVQSGQQWDAIAIGVRAGTTNQHDNAIAIGNRAGNTGQGESAVAIGGGSGGNGGAGQTNQSSGAVAIGDHAGTDTQGYRAVAVGAYAGVYGQYQNAIAIGEQSGYNQQKAYAIAIGLNAGNESQAEDGVAIGRESGHYNQEQYAVAIGYGAGNDAQHTGSIAIGASAGNSAQGNNAIALGRSSGQTSQSDGAVAIGYGAGNSTQGQYAVALGYQAGHGDSSPQGQYSIAIGTNAGYSTIANSSIVLNATGIDFGSSTSGLFINPVRYTETQDVDFDGLVFYNSSSKEIRYSYALDGGDF
jgi:hypothetical protein